MARESCHRLIGSFLSRSRHSARPLLELLEMRLAPAGFTVDRSSDLLNDGAGNFGSLRYCLTQANANPGFDTITIQTTQPITLSSQLQITATVTITDPTGLALIQRDPANPAQFGLFDISLSAGLVTFSNLELTGGHSPTDGGAIANAGNLVLQNCWIHDNIANSFGGGIYSISKLTVDGSTFQANQATRGGGVSIESAATSALTIDFRNSTFGGNRATLDNGGALATTANYATLTVDFFDCTLADNVAGGGVGGAYAYGVEGIKSQFTYQGSLFADNSVTNLGGQGINNVDFVLQSLGNNLSTETTGMTLPSDLSNTDPLLGPLGNYGGLTPTYLLPSGSPAIDKGTTIAGITTDQRGVSRPQGQVADIGAFEARPAQLVLAGNDEFIHVDQTFLRAGSISGDGDSFVFVDFGDGGEGPVFNGPTFLLSHNYSAEGTYDVSVVLTNQFGQVLDSRKFEVDVLLDGTPLESAHKAKVDPSPGTATTSTTDPVSGSSVTATLTHLGTSPNAAIIVAIVPVNVAAGLNGSLQISGNTITSAFDIRAVNVGPDDSVTVVFHYFGNNSEQPILRFFDRATNQEKAVDTDFFIVDPVARTITMIIDKDSIPGILDINGTVFTIAVPLTLTVAPSSPSLPSTSTGQTPDATTISTLENTNNGRTGTGSSDGSSSSGSSSVVQITGGSLYFATASNFLGGRRLTDEPLGDGLAAAENTNLLDDLPIVPNSLITLPGPILTPGSAEMPLPREPANTSVSPETEPPATGQLEDDPLDDVFSEIAAGRLQSRQADWDEPLTDWRDMTLAATAVLALRPPALRRRRSMTNTPDER